MLTRAGLRHAAYTPRIPKPQTTSPPMNSSSDHSPVAAWAAHDQTAHMAPLTIARRAPGPLDVEIDIHFCGVCHTDLHMARNDWGGARYPVVPGHEIVGRVTRVGPEVSRFAEGDWVAVGCMVDACGTCGACEAEMEQHCINGMVMTYGSPTGDPGGTTFGGYAERIVVTESFVLRVPDTLDKAGAAPLLCAGITTWAPMARDGLGPGMRVGVIGLGGLGHMGVKFAHALGAHVTAITRTADKAADAARLGADEHLVSADAGAMAAAAGRFDYLLNTIPVSHDVNPYLDLLRFTGTMCMVGAVSPLPDVNCAGMILGGKALTGSLIGGIAETQRMLDFCGEHGITSDIERINIDEINTALGRMERGDVRYRFVIDMASLRGA